MKSIILMRHSIPDKINISNSLIPLSEAGKKLALSKREEFSYVNRCYSSSYKRAFETARLIMDNVVQEVLNGKFNPTDYFEIDFRNNSLYSIRFRG